MRTAPGSALQSVRRLGRFKDSNTVRDPHFEILLTAINGTDVADFTSRLWAQC
jgi:hypothetical protein